jgi:hypothetical protein
MIIYNYLFYASYKLAEKTRKFDDFPLLGGIPVVALCVMFNIFTIVQLVQNFGFLTYLDFTKNYKYPFVIGLILLLIFYYWYNGRYKKIMSYYASKTHKKLHPILVIISYYIVSIILLVLVNIDW